jgi:hypothetical protein
VISCCSATRGRSRETERSERLVVRKQVCIVGLDWTGWFLVLTEMRPGRDLYCLLVHHCCSLDQYCTSIHQLYSEIQLTILEICPISASSRAAVSNRIDLSSVHQMCKPVDLVHLLAVEFDR